MVRKRRNLPRGVGRGALALTALVAVLMVTGAASAHSHGATSQASAAACDPNVAPPAKFATLAALQAYFTCTKNSFVLPQPVQAGSGKGLKLGYIDLNDSVAFHHAVGVSMKQQAKRAGASLVFCDAQQNPQVALKCVQQMKLQQVAGYINGQFDPTAAAGLCKQGPSVPVVSQDVPQTPCATHLFGANNWYAGYIGGQYLGKFLKAKTGCKYDAYVSEEAPTTGSLNTQRQNGYRFGFQSVCGKIHNQRVVTAFRLDQAKSVFTNTLTALPNAKTIVVAAIDDDAVEGSLAAAKTAGREDAVWAFGQGADSSSWCLIKNDPHYVGSSAYFPERWGDLGISLMVKLLKKQTVRPFTFVKNVVINSKNITQYYKPSNC